MKFYNFTLILSGVDDKTENLEDSLFEAGCGDALINFREGAVYIDFSREANSLEEAVYSAISQVEHAAIRITVVNIEPEHLVSISDIAKRLKETKQAVSLWAKKQRRSHPPFPHPVMKLSAPSPFWLWSDIAKWLMQQDDNEVNKEIFDEAIAIEKLNFILEKRRIEGGNLKA